MGNLFLGYKCDHHLVWYATFETGLDDLHVSGHVLVM